MSKNTVCNRKSRSFSLVEALVAMALFSLVISTLFGLFWHNVRISDELNKLKKNSEKVRRAHSRMQNIFSKLIFKSAQCHAFYSPSKNAGSKYDQGQSIIFTFDNGVDREEGFSYDVVARLYLDTDNKLSLAIWPNPTLKQSKPENIHKEVLLDGVESMNLEFWKVAASKTKVPKDKLEKWISEWEKEYEDVPTLIKITLRYQSGKGIEDLAFSFITEPNDIGAIKYE